MSTDDDREPQIETHRDLRFLEMGAYQHPAPIDVQTEQINQRIEAIHCRLLEGATDGRLTWAGDRIIRRAPLSTACAVHCPPAQPADRVAAGGALP